MIQHRREEYKENAAIQIRDDDEANQRSPHADDTDDKDCPILSFRTMAMLTTTALMPHDEDRPIHEGSEWVSNFRGGHYAFH